jgi:hypothetical protein
VTCQRGSINVTATWPSSKYAQPMEHPHDRQSPNMSPKGSIKHKRKEAVSKDLRHPPASDFSLRQHATRPPWSPHAISEFTSKCRYAQNNRSKAMRVLSGSSKDGGGSVTFATQAEVARIANNSSYNRPQWYILNHANYCTSKYLFAER